MLERMGGLNKDELELGLMMLYQLWQARSDARHKAQIEDPQVTVKRIMYLLEEWRNIETSTLAANSERQAEHWLPPVVG